MKPSNVDEDVDVDSVCTAVDAVLGCIPRPFEERRGPSRKHQPQRTVALPLPRMREVHRHGDPAAWHRWRPPVRVRAVMPAQRRRVRGVAVLVPAGGQMTEGGERCSDEASVTLGVRDRTGGHSHRYRGQTGEVFAKHHDADTTAGWKERSVGQRAGMTPEQV